MTGSLHAGGSVEVVVAGVLAGAVGTAGGITSLVSYPALLLVGLPARVAAITNVVTLVVCWPGSAIASRPELAGTGRWLARWCPVAAAGGALGAGLLLITSPRAFAQIVPALVLLGAVGLVVQPRLTARAPGRRPGVVWKPALSAVMVYNGYFGAGAGVMTLGLLLHGVDPDLPAANARKNMLVGAGNFTAAATLVAGGHPDWSAAAPLAVGLLAGSLTGPILARRLPARVVRWFAATTGIVLAIHLWVSA